MKLQLDQIASAMESHTTLAGEVSSWSIDSRTLAPGDLFFALKGDAHDGHDYVEQVLAAGAAAVVVERSITNDAREILVSDTLEALQRLAAHARKHWGGVVIGITGSAGKTSTKDVVAALLRSGLRTGSTTGNYNNHIGLPLSILQIPDDAQVAVLEMGMNHAHEIEALAMIANPDVGIVTNVGYAHIENFEDGVDGIARAKRELIEALPPDGTAILNYDDERVRAFASIHTGATVYYGLSPEADVRAEDLVLREDGAQFRVGGVQYHTRLAGRHAVRNILAGIAAARVFGIDETRLPEVVQSLVPGKMRGERIEHNGIEVINDCYNSNPEAVRSMLDVLREIPAKRHIAVLGEMLELGRWSEELHREVGRYAARCGVSVLVGIRGVASALIEGAVEAGLRKDAAYFFPEPAEAGAWLREVAQPGDAILFKGSRGTRVEKALEKFLI